MTAFAPKEKLDLHDILKTEGFEFQKRKLRRPGNPNILTICVGTRTLNPGNFGKLVIGINLDADQNHWFVADSWEASQITTTPIHEIKDSNLQMAAAAYISKIKGKLHETRASPAKTEKQPVKEPKKPPQKTQKELPEQVPASSPAPSVPAPKPHAEPGLAMIEQVVKNVTQAGCKITKNTKGYNWEISAHEDDIGLAVDKCIAADKKLRDLLGAEA